MRMAEYIAIIMAVYAISAVFAVILARRIYLILRYEKEEREKAFKEDEK